MDRLTTTLHEVPCLLVEAKDVDDGKDIPVSREYCPLDELRKRVVLYADTQNKRRGAMPQVNGGVCVAVDVQTYVLRTPSSFSISCLFGFSKQTCKRRMKTKSKFLRSTFNFLALARGAKG